MKKTPKALVIGIIIFLASALLVLWNPLQVVQWKIADVFFKGRGASDLITIIAIDDKSLSEQAGLGRFKDWPRSYYSQLLRAVNQHKPAVVAFDLDFREVSRGMSELRLGQLLREYERRTEGGAHGTSMDWYGLVRRFEKNPQAAELTHPDDIDFQKALLEGGSAVLTASLVFPEGPAEQSREFPKHSGVIMPVFRGDNVKIGYKNVMYDRDGILRRFMPVVSDMPSFAYLIARSFLDAGAADLASAPVPPAQEQVLINYAAKPNSFRTISFADALAGAYKPEDIAGKIVLVGATANLLQDIQPTPTSRNFMPGVEVNANIIQQIIEDKPLLEQRLWSIIALLVLFALGGSALFMRLSLRGFGIAFAAALLLFPAFAYAMQQKSFIFNVVYPEAAWILAALAVLWYRNKVEIAKRREIKRAFSHYVSPVIVNELIKDPAALKLGGKREKISVMFSDIVGFTALSEKLSPEDTVALLNDYLSSMTDVVFAYNGTLDKYQGDAIMALFGAPLKDEHHAVNACAAALDMRKALVNLHEKWNALRELPLKDRLINLDFRVGIATGLVVIGNVGSEKRFDYTAIGDIVNLGSRLESINRKYGTRVIVNKETFASVTENRNPFLFRKLDTVRVKGKKQETEVFELVCLAETAGDDVRAMLDDFENGRILYAERNFAEAKRYFESALSRVRDDGPSQIYKNRCDFYIRKPPSLDWTAVVDFTDK